MLRRFALAQAAEIDGDRALRRYAALLALVHPLTAAAWSVERFGIPVRKMLAPGELAICWPFVSGCDAFHVLGPGALQTGLVLYGVLGVVTGALWLTRRAPQAWALHLALEAFKLLVIVQDFRLRMNQHHMALFAALALLLVPGKRDATRVMLVLFYVWAGFLKLTPEWLDGAALPTQPWFVPANMNPLACRYVVVLEIGFAWMLLLRAPFPFWSSLAQLALFHVVSWGVVGFFYPLLMLALLAIFPLVHLEGEAGSVLGRVAHGRLSHGAYALAGAFSLLQVAPRLYPGDTALSGEGRWIGLHMFDARIQCHARLAAQIDGRTVTRPVSLPDVVRERCDPIVVTARATDACARLRTTPGFQTATLVLEAHRTTDPATHRMLELADYCDHPPAYRAFSHNPWIRLDP